ncbi:hypothetical protein DVA86_27715 [Streptomyces armeniacus]|uniref:Putative Flp pilus-assembly TadG-like N-terminal domain-containing protein n=1 Tax=Streptomyces armeniacus TaxID=83291 RepID=A0A345XW33_9ACTN|nr:hypothetical protein DVA86_27715 [Streptomyces armeniacus]
MVGQRLALAKQDDRGQVTAFVVGAFAAAWLFAGIVVDGGLAMAGAARAQDVAQEAARTGAQKLDVRQLRHQHVRLRHTAAEDAARRYVESAGDAGSVSARGNTVTVRVTHHQPTQILQLVGLRTLTARASATAHAERATSH